MGMPKMVADALVTMDEAQRSAFTAEYERRKKASLWGYVLWLCLGWHYAYVGKWGVQLLFWITLGGFFVWWFVDLFRVPGLVGDYNDDVAITALRDVKIISAH